MMSLYKWVWQWGYLRNSLKISLCLLRVKGKKQASKLDRHIWLPLLTTPLLPHLCHPFSVLDLKVPDAVSYDLEKELCTALRLALPSLPCAHRGSSKWSSVLPGTSHGRFMYFFHHQETHALGLSGCCGDRTKPLPWFRGWMLLKEGGGDIFCPCLPTCGTLCFPCANGTCLTSEWINSGDGLTENHNKNEWVFLLKERGDFRSLFSLKLWAFRYRTAVLWETV